MRILTLAIAAALLATPAMAQMNDGRMAPMDPPMNRGGMPPMNDGRAGVMHHDRMGGMNHDGMDRVEGRRAGQRQRMDRGGRQANSDGAYAGGGMVLQGAPGAPAPMPQQTAPAGSISPQGTRSPDVSIVR